jgi:hypothetical protein
MSYITETDVRNFMFDRSAEDNELDMDLSFSPEEVADAMKRAAREVNSIPPKTLSWKPSEFPDTDNTFLYAIAEQLYLSKLQQLMRNDVEYTAGGITGSATAKRIAHFKELIKFMRGAWEPTVKQAKIAANMRNLHYYGN